MHNLTQLACWKTSYNRYGYVISPDQRRRNKGINRSIKEEKIRMRNTHRILLLGTGESGKSTFLRQMRLICGDKFTAEELDQYRDCIYDNVYKGVLFLLQARGDLNIPWDQPEISTPAAKAFQEHYKRVKSQQRERSKLKQFLWEPGEFQEVVPLMITLWKDKAMHTAFSQRSRILADNFSENTEYFLNNIVRIGAPGYLPSNEDVVWSRRPTRGIVEVNLTYRGQYFLNFTDVGGQSTERPRWFLLTGSRNFILFLVAASHYDEYYIDPTSGIRRNKLAEAVDVLQNMDAQKMLTNETSIVLFLNKSDVLEQKITNRVSNIADHFPTFPPNANPYDLQTVQDFIVDFFFTPLRHLSENRKFRYFTTAVNRENINAVFAVVHQSALISNMNSIMMR